MLKEQIANFIGEQYHPHQEFNTLPEGIKNDLIYFSDQILSLVIESIEKIDLHELCGDAELARQAIIKTIKE